MKKIPGQTKEIPEEVKGTFQCTGSLYTEYGLFPDDPLLVGVMTLGGRGTVVATPGRTVAGTLSSGTLAGILVPIFGFDDLFAWCGSQREVKH